MYHRHCSALAALLLVTTMSASGQAWLPWQPVFTGTNALAFSLNPLNDNIIYAARNGVFHVSYDAGATWQARGSVPNFEMRCIAVCRADTSIILMYANGSLLRTTNGGFNWSTVLSGQSMDGETIEFHPTAPDTAFFMDFVTGTMHISPNRGATWSVRAGSTAPSVCSFSINRFNPNLVIAGAGNTRIHRSTDAGRTWTTVRDANPYFSEIPKIKWSPIDSSRAFGATYLDANFSVFASGDGGVSWSPPGIYGIYMWALDVEPVHGHVYVGSFGAPARQGVYKSYDNGESWQRLGVMPNPYCWMIKAGSDSSVTALMLNSAFGTGGIYRMTFPSMGYIAGCLVDLISGTPIDFYSVSVDQTADTVYSGNPGGRFTLALPPGTYTLRLRAAGSEILAEGITVIAGLTDSLRLAAPLNIRTVTVTGTVKNVNGQPVLSRVRFVYAHPTVGRRTAVDTTGADGAFSFSPVTTMYSFDSLVVEPLELPYLPTATTTPIPGGGNDFVLFPADIIHFKGNASSAIADRYRKAFQSVGVTQVEIDAAQATATSDLVGRTNKRTLLWSSRHDSTGIPPAILDTLRAVAGAGHHLILSGQNMAEFNGSDSLFLRNLGVKFAGNLVVSTSTPVPGFPGNPVGDNLTLRVSILGQSSPDFLEPARGGVARAFFYGANPGDTVNIAGVTVDNTGAGGRALVLGFDLDVQQVTLTGEVIRRAVAYFENAISVQELPSLAPGGYALEQNYPNPFNPATAIRYQVSAISEVRLVVYDLLGREVAVLVDERQPMGTHTIVFDASRLSSGVYFYTLRAGTFTRTLRMVLLR